MNTLRPTAHSSVDATQTFVAVTKTQVLSGETEASRKEELKALEEWLDIEHLQVLQIFMQFQTF